MGALRFILNHGARWSSVVTFALHECSTRYQMVKTLDGIRSLSGRTYGTAKIISDTIFGS
jgi:hypothetical protein